MKLNYHKIDQTFIRSMGQLGVPAMRISFSIIFFWFGILKPFGYSAAEPLLKATVVWLPFGHPDFWLIVIGWWEVVIAITFLFRRTTRIAIGLLFLQMTGTFMPLVFLPELSFQEGNLLMPTMIGQYIIKNLLFISAALVIGGTLRKSQSIYS